MDKVNKLTVAGIGPGGREYVLPAAAAAIKNARVLIGGRRALADFAQGGQKTMAITKDITSVVEFIKRELPAGGIVVMVSGDPGFWSFLDTLRREFPVEKIFVIPGISSLQIAFSRLALPWHDAKLLSFHGRKPKDEDLIYKEGQILGFLTDGANNSAAIAKLLLSFGWPPDTPMHILANLSYDNEEIIAATLNMAATSEPAGHCVVIVGE